MLREISRRDGGRRLKFNISFFVIGIPCFKCGLWDWGEGQGD
jgi:hypothetical protein